MTATETELEIESDFKLWLNDQFETPCETKHGKSTCTVKVEWSRGPSLCGCYPRALVCHGTYEFLFGPLHAPITYCSMCKFRAPTEEWKKGWYKV